VIHKGQLWNIVKRGAHSKRCPFSEGSDECVACHSKQKLFLRTYKKLVSVGPSALKKRRETVFLKVLYWSCINLKIIHCGYSLAHLKAPAALCPRNEPCYSLYKRPNTHIKDKMHK
jgi:hypothetical protein